MLGQVLTGQSTVGAQDDYGTGQNCRVDIGKDLAYRLEVPAGARVTTTVTPAPGYDVTLSALLGPDPAVCSALPRQCLDGVNRFGPGDPERMQLINPATTPQTWFILVDSPNTDPSTFSILAQVLPAPPGDVCETATALPVGSTSNLSLEGMFNDYPLDRGRDSTFAITVPSQKRARLTFTQPVDGLVGDLALHASPAACGTQAVLDLEPISTFRDSSEVTYANHAASPVTIYAVVDAQTSTPQEYLFNLVLALEDYPAHDICADAQPLPLNMSTPVTLVGFTDDYNDAGTTCSSFAVTPAADRVFSITAPAGKLLTVDVQAASTNGSVGASLLDSCAPVTCLASEDNFSGNFQVRHFNATAQDLPLLLLLDGDDTAGFTVQAATSDPVPGTTCQDAMALTLGVPTAATTVGAPNLVDQYGGTCGAAFGTERFFTAQVPAGRTLRVELTNVETNYDPELNILTGCGPNQCLAHSDAAGGGRGETTTWTNPGAHQTVTIAVDGYNSGDLGAFTITATLL